MPEIKIDFLSKTLLYRCKHTSLRKELLARAIGFRPRQKPYLVEATAGLGRDSFVLAALGFHVTMLERSLIVYQALVEALNQAKQNPYAAPIASRLELIHADAIDWLPAHQKKANVIYLDPMFPTRSKSASVRKEMLILQDLLGKEADLEKLFEVALTCATDRVVIKRPRLSQIVCGKEPNFSLMGNSSRFDVYLSNK